ncbi:DUF6343 family protein [Streptomyces eurythermus]|uniref:DUF6343 family protein n=1 Tax=Streptomyces eurythermus TaxID=42237 RepID=UPI003702A976
MVIPGGSSAPPVRSGATGRRSVRVRTGSEPTTARSPLGLRMALSAVFPPLFAAATAGLAVWAAHQGPGDSPNRGPLTVLAVICGGLTSAAAADLMVVRTRRRQHERADASA